MSQSTKDSTPNCFPKSLAAPTLEEQLAGRKPHSQFERSLAELGVDLLHAHSPQAKGRVERLFGTFQDRLIKELRLAGSATVAAANDFLERYLPQYNQRFAVPPAQAADLHRPAPAAHDTAGRSPMKPSPLVRRARRRPPRSTSPSAWSSQRRGIRGASVCCLNEGNRRWRPIYKPDISTLGETGHF